MTKHIKLFPDFTDAEKDDLRKKIVNGIAEDWGIARATDRTHWEACCYRPGELVPGWTDYPCWIFLGKWEDGKGYKKFKFKGHTLYVHRTACELFNGPLDIDQHADHLCRVRGCCQPAHLEGVPPKENILRGDNPNYMLRTAEPAPVSVLEQLPLPGKLIVGDAEISPDRDWKRFDAMTDAQVMAAARSAPDAQPLTEADAKRMKRVPQEKVIRQAAELQVESDRIGVAQKENYDGYAATAKEQGDTESIMAFGPQPSNAEFLDALDKILAEPPLTITYTGKGKHTFPGEPIINGYVPPGSAGLWLRNVLLGVKRWFGRVGHWLNQDVGS